MASTSSRSRCDASVPSPIGVVWVNPHRGKAGYQPIQQGIVAALPYCDDLVAGHSLRTFEALAEVVDHA